MPADAIGGKVAGQYALFAPFRYGRNLRRNHIRIESLRTHAHEGFSHCNPSAIARFSGAAPDTFRSNISCHNRRAVNRKLHVSARPFHNHIRSPLRFAHRWVDPNPKSKNKPNGNQRSQIRASNHPQYGRHRLHRIWNHNRSRSTSAKPTRGSVHSGWRNPERSAGRLLRCSNLATSCKILRLANRRPFPDQLSSHPRVCSMSEWG